MAIGVAGGGRCKQRGRTKACLGKKHLVTLPFCTSYEWRRCRHKVHCKRCGEIFADVQCAARQAVEVLKAFAIERDWDICSIR